MSYNWTSASTPQGRERLKELIENKYCVHCFHRASGHFLSGVSYCWNSSPDQKFHAVSISWTKNFLYIDGIINWAVENNIEFLDPSPSPEPVADENGLLPCPFCGGKAIVAEHDLLYTRFIANCESCEAESSVFLKREEAIEAWNRREGKETNP